MPWDRTVSLYIDIDSYGSGRQPMLDTLTSALLQDTPTWIQSDKFTLRLYFRRRASTVGAASTSVQLSSGSQIVLAAKKQQALGLTTLLFNAMDFTETLDGSDYYYSAEVDLHTTELAAALGSDSAITAVVDVEVENSDNTLRQTFQFSVLVKHQAYSGEADPTPGTPVYPAPAFLLLRSAIGSQALIAGQDYVDLDLTSFALMALPTIVPGAVIKPSSGASNVIVAGQSGIGTTTARIHFMSTVPADGYSISFILK